MGIINRAHQKQQKEAANHSRVRGFFRFRKTARVLVGAAAL